MNPASQRHLRKIAELRTNADLPTLARAALKGENPLWFTQGSPAILHLQARVKFMDREPSEFAKRQSAVLVAAQKDGGWRLASYRVFGFQSVKVVEKNGCALTEAGADALLSGQYAKIG